MYAKYRRRFEYAIDRIDADFHFGFHHVTTNFFVKSSLSKLDFDLAAYVDDTASSRIVIGLKSMITLDSLHEEHHFDVLKWISNCRKHLWPPPRSGQHKVSEDSVMLDIARHILVPLCQEVTMEKRFEIFLKSQQPMPYVDVHIKTKDIGMGSVDTWHGTPDSRVRGAEILLSSRICYEDEDDIRANSSGDESIVSDGTTANIEGKVTAKDLAQVVGTCVISSFTEKSVHPEQSPLVPSFLVDKDKFRVVLYNCEKDLLLISDLKLLSTNGYLSQSSMAFLWIMINHR